MLSQIVQFAHLYDVILNDVDVDLRAQFDSANKYDLPGPGGEFQCVAIKVRVSSPSPEEQVKKLLAHAERGCHAARSLQANVPVEIQIEIKP